MKIEKMVFIIVLSICCFFVYPEQNDEYQSTLSLRITPGADIPVGSSTTYFEPGLLTGISALVTPKAISPFLITGSFEFVRNLRDEDQYLSKFGLSAGGGINLGLRPWLSIFAGIEGGYSFCMMDTDSGAVYSGIPVITVTAGPSFDILPAMSLNLNASYQSFTGLTDSIGLTAGITVRIKDKQTNHGPPVLEGLPPKIINLEFETIFPVFYKYYDDHPTGNAIILNPREDEITDISLDFYVNQYMDTPKRCTIPETLAPGETGNIDIIALFNNSVLGITEGTKVAAELTLSYKVDGVQYTDVISETMRMQYRNAMTWDDDRRAAAFVTAKDPTIMGFAKNVASMLHEIESSAINRNLQKAMAIHDALSLYGLTYVIDPTTSYAELSEQKTSIDFLQFPRETLEYRAGDCDDLSILYCALFEAVGIESAFITVPGHIFVAFSLGVSTDEAVRTFYNRDNLIFRDEKVWIPFEITALKESFLEGWETGAREWRGNEPEGNAGFFPIRDAWQYYEPVGLPGAGGTIDLPDSDMVINKFTEELSSFISKELDPQIERISMEIERSQGSPRSYNKRGVLYARYGLNEEAVEEFEMAIETDEFFPSLINIGNILFLEKQMDRALEYYNRAYELHPDNPRVILSMARTHHSMGNSDTAAEYYTRLKELDPDLAEQFSYLDPERAETERASNINGSENIVVWEEAE